MSPTVPLRLPPPPQISTDPVVNAGAQQWAQLLIDTLQRWTIAGGNYLPITGGTLTGDLAIQGTHLSFDAGTITYPDPNVWNASYVRFARNLPLAGTGVSGSANEWTATVQAVVPSGIGAAANYEKAALFVQLNQNDGSGGGVTADGVGLNVVGHIPSGNTTGRIWGINCDAVVASGADGQAQAAEFDVVNNATADVTSFTGTKAKAGISIVAAGSQNSTGAINIAAGVGVTWHKGVRFQPGAMATGAADALLELDNTFAIGSASDGKIKWGSGSAYDASLYRQTAANLRTDSLVESMRPSSGDFCFAGFVSGDTSARWIVDAAGKMQWGAGSSLDCSLFRQTAKDLRTDSLIESVRGSSTDFCFAGFVTADTSARWIVDAAGKMQWGAGSSLDTSLSRSAANVLTTGTGTLLHVSPEARVFHNAGQSPTNGTNTALNFNSERFDNDTIHDTVTNNTRLTCKTAGKYLIGGSIEWASNATGVRDLSITLNGTTAIVYEREEGLSANSLQQSVATLYDLAVNDYVELTALQTSGGALAVNSVGNYTPEFWMVKVG